MNSNEIIVSRKQLDAVIQAIQKNKAFTETMWRQYGDLANDPRYSDRRADSEARADIYCDITRMLTSLETQLKEAIMPH